MRFQSITIIVLMFCVTAAGQKRASYETRQSYESARAILEQSLEAHGGRRRLEALASLSFTFKGTHSLPLQNLRPDFSQNPLPKEGRLVYDVRNGKVSLEEKNSRPGLYTGWHRLISDGTKTFDLNLRSRQYRPASATALSQRVNTLLPHLILLEAARRAATLRRIGEAGYRGARHHVICFAGGTGQQLTLYIDRRSKRLAKAETLASLPVYGDSVWEYAFGGYAVRGGVLLPGERVVKLNGATAEAVEYSDFEIGTDVDGSAFAVPPEFVARDDNAVRAAQSARVTELAKDVYTVEDAQGTDLKVLFVVFEEFVLVAGAPQGVSDYVIARAKEVARGKPVRYVVPTHHHSDHAGGLRSYIAEGAKVVTTLGNRDFVAAMAAARFSISPDRLALNPRRPVVEIIEGKRRVIADATHRVEVYDIGPTPHAEEMLVVYLPGERLLYQGDLLELDDDDPITELTANEVTDYFYERLVSLGLKVDKIIGTEGRAATLEDLRKAVRLRGQAQSTR